VDGLVGVEISGAGYEVGCYFYLPLNSGYFLFKNILMPYFFIKKTNIKILKNK
jgi:hypothetical protein